MIVAAETFHYSDLVVFYGENMIGYDVDEGDDFKFYGLS